MASNLFEWTAAFQLTHVVVDACSFALQKAFNRIGKRWVRQPVGACGFDGQESPRHFVLALRPAFKADNSMLNAPLQRLVVADLKMQAVDAGQRSPVAAVGG